MGKTKKIICLLMIILEIGLFSTQACAYTGILSTDIKKECEGIYNLKYEKVCDPAPDCWMMAYVDLYYAQKDEDYYIAGILGIKCFIHKSEELQGLYGGVGYPFLRGSQVLWYPGKEEYDHMETTFSAKTELIAGYLASIGKRSMLDAGYSTRKGAYLDLGIRF